MEFVTILGSAPIRVFSIEQFVIFRHGWNNDDFTHLPFDVLLMPFMVEGCSYVFQLVQEDVYDTPNLLMVGERAGVYSMAVRIEIGDALEAVAGKLGFQLPKFHDGMSLERIWNEKKVREDCRAVIKLCKYDFI